LYVEREVGRTWYYLIFWGSKQAFFQDVRKLDLKDAESKAHKSKVGMYGKPLYVGSCEPYDEPLYAIKCWEFLDQLNSC
jgi:hypothetical protein